MGFVTLRIFVSQTVVQRTAGPEGGAGEAGGREPDAFSGKGAADVQAAPPRLVLEPPPAQRGARDPRAAGLNPPQPPWSPSQRPERSRTCCGFWM